MCIRDRSMPFLEMTQGRLMAAPVRPYWPDSTVETGTTDFSLRTMLPIRRQALKATPELV